MTDGLTTGEADSRPDTGPRHVGVGGLGMAAARIEPRASAAAALSAVRAWLPVSREGVGRLDRFPYEPVLAHHQGAGRAGAAHEVIEWLRRIADLLPASGPEPSWPLASWLPVAADRVAGTREAHVATNLLVRAPGNGAESTDQLIAAVAADLALVEATALRWGQPGRKQLRRTQACLRLLADLPGFAPLGPQRAAVPPRLLAGDVQLRTAVAEVTWRVATQVRLAVPESCRTASALSLLPLTRLHDEQALIRMAQLFELQSRQLHRCLVSAGSAARGADHEAAAAVLDEAIDRLRLAAALDSLVLTVEAGPLAGLERHAGGLGPAESRGAALVDDALRALPLEPAVARADPVAGRLRVVDACWPALRVAHPFAR